MEGHDSDCARCDKEKFNIGGIVNHKINDIKCD